MERKSKFETLKKKIRQNSELQRNVRRINNFDSFRLGLGEINSHVVDESDNITAQDILKISARIKRRKHADCNDLQTLSQGFLQATENIITFANIPGALNIVVKVLTGQNSEEQIAALEVLCNLSLEEDFVCHKIASQAGSYLVTFLGSADLRVKQSSIWTLLNIIASGGKGLDVLLQLGILNKISKIFYSNNRQENSGFINDAALCLNQIFVHKTFLDLKYPIVARTFDKMIKLPHEDRRNQFLIENIFNSSIVYSKYVFNDQQLEYIAIVITKYVLKMSGLINMQDSIANTLYHVRVLSIFICFYKKQFVILLEKILSANNLNLVGLTNLLFTSTNESFIREVVWFYQNLIKVVDNESVKSELIKILN